jgi:hemerythrin superfamily protein
MADIVEMIQEDHHLIRRLLGDLQEREEVRDIRYMTLRRELQTHMHAEEATIYRRLIADIPEDVADLLEEHNRMRELIGRLDTTSLEDPAWGDYLIDLRDQVDAHFSREDGLLLKRALEVLSQVERYEMYEEFQMEKGVMAQYT